MVRWMRWHCPPDTGFEIRSLARPSTLPLGHWGSYNIESSRLSSEVTFVSLKPECQSGVRAGDPPIFQAGSFNLMANYMTTEQNVMTNWNKLAADDKLTPILKWATSRQTKKPAFTPMSWQVLKTRLIIHNEAGHGTEAGVQSAQWFMVVLNPAN